MGFAANTPAVHQSLAWDCSAASLAWLLTALGNPTGEQDAISLLNGSINAAVGLTDASGAPLASVLQSQGFAASNGGVGYGDVQGMAMTGTPLAIGGIAYNHWTGVRGADGDDLLLANPAPGWKSVGDRMSRDQFAVLGPFYAVWVSGVSAVPSGGGGSAVSVPIAGSPGVALPSLTGVVAWVQANPLAAAAIAAAFILLTR